MRTLGGISAAGALLVLTALAARAPSLPESRADRARAPRPAREAAPPAVDRAKSKPLDPRVEASDSVAEPEPPPDEERAEERFWEEVAGLLDHSDASDIAGRRDAVLRRTSAYLETRPEAWPAFEAATRRAREEIDRAWAWREAAWATLSANVGLDAELREQLEREIHGRYEREKQAALESVGTLLATGDRGVRLRVRLEEWFDAVR